MLRGIDYERIYRSQGKTAADTEFRRQMKPENIKFLLAVIVLIVAIVLAYFVK